MAKAEQAPVNLEELDYDDQTFADWIGRSLNGYYFEGKGRFAFRPFDSHFEREYNVAYDLAIFFQKLSAIGRSNFNKGLAIALKTFENSPNNLSILSCILETAQHSKATNILPVILGMLREHPNNEPIVRVAMNALASLATNAGDTGLSKVSIECFEALSRSDVLDATSAAIAFTFLCKVRPEHVSMNVSMFRDKMDIALGISDDIVEEAGRQKKRARILEQLLAVADCNSVLTSLATDQNFDEFGQNWWRDMMTTETELASELLKRCALTVEVPEQPTAIIESKHLVIKWAQSLPSQYKRIIKAYRGLIFVVSSQLPRAIRRAEL